MARVTFSFRNRFVISDPLNGPSNNDRDTISLYYGGIYGGSVNLSAPEDGKSFNHARELRLRGDAFETLEEATEAGKLWRDRLTIAFAHYEKGIDIGLDDTPDVAEWGFAHPYFVYEPEKYHRDTPKLTVFATADEPTFSGFAMEGVVAHPIETFVRGPLKWVTERDGRLNARTALAYRLFHASYFESNPETIYILLFTGIEALIPEKYRKADFIAVLEELRQALDVMDGVDETARESIDNLLEYKENESIRFRGRTWVRDTLGSDRFYELTPEEYFLAAYATRNKIAHGNVDRPTPRKLRSEIPELRRFLLALLDMTVFGELMPGLLEYGQDGTVRLSGTSDAS